MRSEASIRTVSVILFAALGFACFAALPAHAVDRGTISLRGTVLAEDGTPLVNTWVFSKGSRRVSALSAEDGSYLLDVPGGTVAELIRAPLELRIQARRKGWRVRLADGAPELLLELRILVDSTGTARLRVRSSDPAVANAVAAEAVTGGSPAATLNVDFRGVQEPAEGPTEATITAVEEVVLSGVDLPPGQPSAARPGPIVIPTGLRAGTRTSAPAPEPEVSDEAKSAPAPAKRTAPREPKQAIQTPKTDSPASVAPGEPKPPKVKHEKPRKEKKNRKERSREKDDARLGKAKEDMTQEEPAPDASATQEPGAAPRVYRPAEPATGAPPAEPRVYRPALPSKHAPQGDGGAPRVYRPAEAPERASGTAQTPRVIRSSETVLFDSLATAPDSAANATPATSAPAVNATPAEPIPVPAVTKPSAAAPAPGGPPVTKPNPAEASPKPDGGTPPSAGAAAQGRTPDPGPSPVAPPGQAPEPDAWCTCRVEGFVEVRSEQRINGFLRVRVWLDGHPEIHGEVELFMGSPRGFVLRSVPCGPQKVRFEVRSKQSYELISSEPRVDCTDGGVRQVRLVLQPAKGRGR